MVLKSFNDAIEAKGMSPANEGIMRKLCSLYAMYWMVQNSGEFMTVSFCVCVYCEFDDTFYVI